MNPDEIATQLIGRGLLGLGVILVIVILLLRCGVFGRSDVDVLKTVKRGWSRTPSWSPSWRSGTVLGLLVGALIPNMPILLELLKRFQWSRGGGRGESAEWGEPLFYFIVLGVRSGLVGAVVGALLMGLLSWLTRAGVTQGWLKNASANKNDQIHDRLLASTQQESIIIVAAVLGVLGIVLAVVSLAHVRVPFPQAATKAVGLLTLCGILPLIAGVVTLLKIRSRQQLLSRQSWAFFSLSAWITFTLFFVLLWFGPVPMYFEWRKSLGEVKARVAGAGDINTANHLGQTPLHQAAIGGHMDAAQLLIAKGADVNAKDTYGQTPLHCAIINGKKDVAELLIAKGTGVNLKNKDGATALHEAVLVSRGDTKIVELLLSSGADVNVKWPVPGDNEGLTPLRLAINQHKTEVAELLRKHGAKE